MPRNRLKNAFRNFVDNKKQKAVGAWHQLQAEFGDAARASKVAGVNAFIGFEATGLAKVAELSSAQYL